MKVQLLLPKVTQLNSGSEMLDKDKHFMEICGIPVF